MCAIDVYASCHMQSECRFAENKGTNMAHTHTNTHLQAQKKTTNKTAHSITPWNDKATVCVFLKRQRRTVYILRFTFHLLDFDASVSIKMCACDCDSVSKRRFEFFGLGGIVTVLFCATGARKWDRNMIVIDIFRQTEIANAWSEVKAINSRWTILSFGCMCVFECFLRRDPKHRPQIKKKRKIQNKNNNNK